MTSALRWAVLAMLTLYGFYVVPGHTFLLSDTQIYSPMLDRIADPTLYTRELVAQRQHLSLTVWDELAMTGSRLTGATNEQVLAFIQFASRFAGLYGLFLLGTAFGLAELPALLIPALLGLGATMIGPAVLTVEYEPVPRGIAVMLTLLAAGFTLHGKSKAAAIAAGLGILIHAPAVVPFLIVFLAWQLWTRNLRPLLWLAGAAALSIAFAILQPGTIEAQQFFSTVDPEWEKLQRMRAPYNWLSTWKPWMLRNFLLNGFIAGLATWRIWKHLSVPARVFAVAVPAIGVLSLPLAWLLMESWKWTLMAQVQPGRSVLYTVVFALATSVAAALFAIRNRSWFEAAAWLLPSIFTFLHGYLWEEFTFPKVDLQYSALAIVLTVAAGWMATYASRGPAWATVAAAALIVAVPAVTGWLWQDVLKRSNYPNLKVSELNEAAAWAKANTPRDAMFLLPQLVNAIDSGIFRVRAQRALFVDWKIGGQVNYSRELSLEWWRRMQLTEQKHRPLESWANEGVDYLVLKAATACPATEVFRNAKYSICKLNR